MRHALLSLVVASCVLTATRVKGQEPVTSNDKIAEALWRIAIATNTQIGFQATDITRVSGYLERVPARSISTLVDGLNAAVGSDDRYDWRKVQNIVIVRSKRAWDDPNDVFNRPIQNVHVENESLSAVLFALRDYIYTDKFVVIPKPTTTQAPVSFSLQSGTVIDVLNELMVASDQLLWIGSYRPLGQPPAERVRGWNLSLDIRGAHGVNAFTSSYPPRR